MSDKERKIAFTFMWAEQYLDIFIAKIQEGYSIFTALVLTDSGVLPREYLIIESIAEAKNAEDELTDSEWQVYKAVKTARLDDPSNLRLSHRTGRPSVKTPQLEEMLILGFEAGLTEVGTCGYAGICPKTLYNWKQEDEEFLHKIEGAKAFGQARLELAVLRGKDYNPKQAMEILRRRYPEWQDTEHIDTKEDITIEIITTKEGEGSENKD